jgi:16S rRNA (uracil1498-N3)-methyltransferase
MRLHRFYISPDGHHLDQKFWLRDERIIPQWQRVLRYQPGQQVVLFDGQSEDKLYKIVEFNDDAAHLEHVTDMRRKLPAKDIYLAWALLKKDKNDWVLQKATELGANHFVPLLTERCEKTGFNEERAQKIVIEASEQCGRSNIPSLREPIQLQTLFEEFKDKLPLLVCEQESAETLDPKLEQAVLIIGPEGGWSEAELELFKANNVQFITMGDFTHRAETASIAALSKLL